MECTPRLPRLPSVRRLIERCLDRDPRRRLRDIGEARMVLEESAPAAMVGRQSDVSADVPSPHQRCRDGGTGDAQFLWRSPRSSLPPRPERRGTSSPHHHFKWRACRSRSRRDSRCPAAPAASSPSPLTALRWCTWRLRRGCISGRCRRPNQSGFAEPRATLPSESRRFHLTVSRLCIPGSLISC